MYFTYVTLTPSAFSSQILLIVVPCFVPATLQNLTGLGLEQVIQSTCRLIQFDWPAARGWSLALFQYGLMPPN